MIWLISNFLAKFYFIRYYQLISLHIIIKSYCIIKLIRVELILTCFNLQVVQPLHYTIYAATKQLNVFNPNWLCAFLGFIWPETLLLFFWITFFVMFIFSIFFLYNHQLYFHPRYSKHFFLCSSPFFFSNILFLHR